LPKLDYAGAVRFWRRNDAAKTDLDRERDPEGLAYGLYDDFPVWINRYYARFQSRVFDRFVSQVDLRRDQRVLEIGCGSGRWCGMLARDAGADVTGLDVGLRLLQRNRAFFGERVRFVCALASALPFADASFDLAFSVAVVHHLPFEIQERALDEIRRVVKPGKHVFLMESVETGSRSPHLFARPFGDWSRLLESRGFEILDSAGQEFIDFRKIIRPMRKRLKRLAGAILPGGSTSGGETSDDGRAVNRSRLSASQQLFHLPFFPLVMASHLLELGLSRWGKRDWANYACMLARRA
jgi:SAM-dependent methyltransferase